MAVTAPSVRQNRRQNSAIVVMAMLNEKKKSNSVSLTIGHDRDHQFGVSDVRASDFCPAHSLTFVWHHTPDLI